MCLLLNTHEVIQYFSYIFHHPHASCMCFHGHFLYFKVEYHANENPLKYSEKIAYVGQRLMYPIKKLNLTILVLLIAIMFLGFYINNSSFFYRKHIAKITNPITKPKFLTITKLTFTRIK